MSNLFNLARPYARAIFELASTEKQIGEWSKILEEMAKIINDPKVEKILKNPKLTANEQTKILVALLDEKSSLEKEVTNLIKLLAEKKRLTVIPEIAKLFVEYRQENERVLNVRISSVVKLPEDTRERLLEILHKKLGSNIKLQNEIDPDLMGGIVVRAGDLVIDGSVRGELERLRGTLIN